VGVGTGAGAGAGVNTLESHSGGALVAAVVELGEGCSKGTPERGTLICCPTLADLRNLAVCNTFVLTSSRCLG
jgi:hypothetical protein